MIKEWIRKPDGTWEDHWIDIVYEYEEDQEYEEGLSYWNKASVRFDGCIHLDVASNEPYGNKKRKEDSENYIHICDIDQFIEMLIKLREVAKNHFGNEW